ncbi:MAG: methylglyoxal synthase [Clostridiales bacterium]|nr:methylglyoxal synthase [Clostridiales bacterium]
MNIALVAHDKKKELMGAFCIAYKSILSKHSLVATAGTASVVEEASGLEVVRVSHGIVGEQQLSSKAAYDEIDLVIFFRDPITKDINEPDIGRLLNLCDQNHIPFATNIATAELLIKSLERGELEWRNNIR